MYQLTERSYEEPEGIECKFYFPDEDQTDRMIIMIASFSGNYPNGSLGNDHGAFVSIKTMCGLHSFNPDCVILDFRDMEYQWGNTLLAVFQDVSQFMDSGKDESDPFFPILAVVSEKCGPAFLSLVTPTGETKPDWCFDDLDVAIDAAVKRAKDWLEI